MSTATYEIQRALYDALLSDATVMDLVEGVFDDVPDNQPFPYIQIGEETETNKPSTMLVPGRESTLTIHIWSRAHGYHEAKAIAGKIIGCLEDRPLTLAGWQWTSTLYEFGQFMRDADGITRHGILRFRVRSQQA
jgi:hypothetical protein